MNRRDSLKAIGVSALSAGLLLNSCKTDTKGLPGDLETDELDETEQIGLEEFEKDRLRKLRKEPAFFNNHERLTLIALADHIIPADEVSGSASEAKVIDFLDFIVKDIPDHQVPLRGGLKWLDVQCLNRYGNSFLGSNGGQQIEMLEEIAYPSRVKSNMRQGAVFFSRLRDLVASGFYTSEMGIKDIGYVGNVPGLWEGVPKDVLAQYNLGDT